ncbi:hypothetical protein DCAR_0521357 [Daucus carota subsp. sativus]|uniref:CASP-like protein n=2 Tax=Daucus carota subsp. sativus TaxID=79200 RepID=A0AAF1B0X6_DAUCS|nr:PREDICTED: CASP-like protein 4B1 [Daucus carota subsp. sativus]WOH01970.1 hypothetical protein DCAR_0521357 [Daucus carota subsp. sativus]
MSNLEEAPQEKAGASQPMQAQAAGPAPVSADLENQRAVHDGFGVAAIVNKWNRDDKLKRASWALRGIALLFSLVSFLVMACNKHGGWENFDNYEEYQYLLAIAILSTLYTGAQVARQVQELRTGKEYLSPRMLVVLNFIGDQIMAYLLMSAASAAVPLTNRMREGSDTIFTDSSSSAISMAFLAFFALALAALVSGYKLCTYSYI